MKILIFLSRWPGGVGVVINSIKKELENKGHKVVCISREEDLKIYSSVKKLRNLRKNYIYYTKKEKPDIIYTQDWSMALPLLFPYPLFSDKHFCCFHGNQLGKAKIIQKIIGELMRGKLIVVGDSLREKFLKSNLVYNGVDLEKFKPLNKKRVYLGWINKSTETLTKSEIFNLGKKLNLIPLIAENFNIPFDKMNKEFYNKCKVFISLPPVTAGFNLCWVEAMAAGVPIIIGNEEGIGRKIEITKFKSKKELFQNINKLDKKDYRKQIEKSYLTWKSHVDNLIKIWSLNN